MLYSDFYNDFLKNYDEKNLDGSMTSLMNELGNIIVTNRTDFEDLLSESGIEGDFSKMSDSELVDKYIESIEKNKDLQLGTSMLINYHNQESNMDGDNEMNDACVKAGYHTISVFFANPSENYSNAAGLIVGAVAGAAQEGAKLGGKIVDARQKKKFGNLDLASKKQDARAQITQQILAQRQAEIQAKTIREEASGKNKKIILIVGGSLLAITIIGVIMYKLKKR